jgi:hypothetical protein
VERPKLKRGKLSNAQRIAIYGAGGTGKTTLCSLLPQVGINPLFVDLESSSAFLDVARVEPANYNETRSVLQDFELISQFDCIVVDTMTKLEEHGVDWVIANVPHEKGRPIERFADYGFGRGFEHSYEASLRILNDLDAIIRYGKHVVTVCHSVTQRVPSAESEDYLQYQPRLQSPPNVGKFRERLKEWTDHLLFVEFDKIVKDGKASGGGTRTIHTSERPHFWAKSRSMTDSIPYEFGSAEVWRQLFNVS